MSFKETAKNLDLLGLLFIIFGGMIGAIFIFALTFMAFALNETRIHDPEATPFIGGAMIGIFLFGLVFSLLNILSGISIRKRKNKTLTYVAAGLDLFSFPFGTALGIGAFIMLNKTEAEQLYAGVNPDELQDEFFIHDESGEQQQR